MCIAIAMFSGKMLEKETAQNCWDSNDDGAGFAFADGGRVRIVKGLMTFDDFWKAYTKWDLNDVPHLIHFRISTSGKLDRMNTHPWRVTKDIALIHNGILRYPHTNRLSDTGNFVKSFLRPLARGMGTEFIMFNEGFHDGLEPLMGTSKFCMINGDGEISIINDKAGQWELPIEEEIFVNGSPVTRKRYQRWYSNSSYMAWGSKRSKRYGTPSTTKTSYSTTSLPSENFKPVYEGVYQFLPLCMRYSGPEGDYINDSVAIERGWTQHNDRSWTPPDGWEPDYQWGDKTFDEGPGDGDTDEILASWERFESNLADELAEERRRQEDIDATALEEQRCCREEFSKHHILKPSDGSNYSIRRCDLSVEVRSSLGVAWSVIRDMTDQELLDTAVTNGLIEETAV